jgi:hypothetical protein
VHAPFVQLAPGEQALLQLPQLLLSVLKFTHPITGPQLVSPAGHVTAPSLASSVGLASIGAASPGVTSAAITSAEVTSFMEASVTLESSPLASPELEPAPELEPVPELEPELAPELDPEVLPELVPAPPESTPCAESPIEPSMLPVPRDVVSAPPQSESAAIRGSATAIQGKNDLRTILRLDGSSPVFARRVHFFARSLTV